MQYKEPWDSLYIKPKNKNPLYLHEIPEWPLQTPTWMGIFHPRNWPRQENSLEEI